MTFYLDRYVLGRVICICNNKGGVGKTTLAAHIAALMARKLQAEGGGKVLLVDLDEQGNLGEDLGYTGRGLSDHGLGLSRAVSDGDAPYIISDVRPGLDVIPGGREIVRLAVWLQGRTRSLLPQSDYDISTDETVHALAIMLSKVAQNYDYIILDCPPHNQLLQELALIASEYVLIPSKTDMSSRLGIRKMAQLFASARVANTGLKLLGVVLFGVTPAAKAIRRDATEWIAQAFASVPEEIASKPVVYKGPVRHVEGPAFHVRERGQLAHELELGAEVGVTKTMANSVTGVAGDFTVVTTETLTRVFAFEQAAAAAIEAGEA